MNILHISTSDSGGAGNAAIRLHIGLLKQGLNSKFLTYYKKHNHPEVYSFDEDKNIILKNINFFKFGFWEGINRIRLWNRPKNFEIFTYPKSILDVQNHPLIEWADIIHLHWIAYFIDYPSFFKAIKHKNIVWTLHDMNPFTGGCHYSRYCSNYLNNCTNCPQLEGTLSKNYSNKIFKIKEKSYRDLNLKIVTPSNWLKDCSENSSLFKKYRHYHIRNGINKEKYKPLDKSESRKILKLNDNEIVLLFVADWLERPAKGLNFLLSAMEQINLTNLKVILIGKSDQDYTSDKIKQIGFVDFDKLSQYYSAADALIIPSLEDNLPNTIVESHLFGTPVIGFPVGGIPEMIEHHKTGIIADAVSVDALKSSILDFSEIKHKFDAKYIREKAIELYNIDSQVKKYIEIYSSF